MLSLLYKNALTSIPIDSFLTEEGKWDKNPPSLQSLSKGVKGSAETLNVPERAVRFSGTRWLVLPLFSFIEELILLEDQWRVHFLLFLHDLLLRRRQGIPPQRDELHVFFGDVPLLDHLCQY